VLSIAVRGLRAMSLLPPAFKPGAARKKEQRSDRFRDVLVLLHGKHSGRGALDSHHSAWTDGGSGSGLMSRGGGGLSSWATRAGTAFAFMGACSAFVFSAALSSPLRCIRNPLSVWLFHARPVRNALAPDFISSNPPPYFFYKQPKGGERDATEQRVKRDRERGK